LPTHEFILCYAPVINSQIHLLQVISIVIFIEIFHLTLYQKYLIKVEKKFKYFIANFHFCDPESTSA
jgi:hypothetical protein